MANAAMTTAWVQMATVGEPWRGWSRAKLLGKWQSSPATNGLRATAPSRVTADRFHQAVQRAGLLRRNGNQNAGGAENVDPRDHGRGDRERPRHGASRIADLSTHERGGLRASPGEGYRRPENGVGEAQTRDDRLSSDRGRHPEAPPDRESEDDKHDRLQPARNRPRAVEPFRARQPAHVERDGDAQGGDRKADEIGRRGAHGGIAMARPEQRAAGREVQQAGKERQIGGPVRPAGHEPGEWSEGTLAPDV